MPGEDRDLRCNGCGQGWALRQTDIVNQVPPRFCPSCGTATLVRETGRLIDGAACFKGIPEGLVAGLYNYWRDGMRDAEAMHCCFPYRRFVDYMRGVLAGHLVLDLTTEDEDAETETP